MDVVSHRRWSSAGWWVNPRNGVSVVGMVVLCLALFAPTPCAEVSAQTVRDSIPVSRWIDSEGREPITYDEWRDKQPPKRPFKITEISHSQSNNSVLAKPFDAGIGFGIYVDADLYPEIEFELQRYAIELTGEGFAPEIYTVSGGTPEDLRAHMRERYEAGMEGCILIGDLPVAWFEINSGEYEEYPSDIFFMDVDGDFVDADGDGLYDTHLGTYKSDIWVGRLTASTLTYNDADETTLMKHYFFMNHQYRSGLAPLENKALLYIDDDWANSGDFFRFMLSELYDSVVVVNDPWTTWDSDYEQRLTEGYELVHLDAHSTAFHHTFERAPYSLGETGFAEIADLNPKVQFCLLSACSSVRFVERNYIGGWYVFGGDWAVAAIGTPKLGGFPATTEFVRPFAQGNPIGKGLMDFNNTYTSLSAYSDHLLIGDPSLQMNENSYEYLRYDSDDVLDNYPLNYYPSPGWDPFRTRYTDSCNVRFDAPCDATLDEIHFDAGIREYGHATLFIWESDGHYPTKLIDSIYVNPVESAFDRKDISHLGIRVQKGDIFHVGVVSKDHYELGDVIIYAHHDLDGIYEDRSVAFVDGRWQTLQEAFGVDDNLSIRVCYDPAPGTRPEITPVELAKGQVGTYYEEMLSVSGGQPPYDWSVIAGSLPDGIEFNTASASISGTPTLASTGTYVFTVQVTDTDDPPNTDIQHLQLSIPYCQDSDGDDFGDPEQTANTCPTDNCPDIFNPLQEDIDGDGIGDSCEVIRSWLVSADASGDAPTIQAAIDSCTNGDTVVIGDGYFTGVGNSDFQLGGRQILIMSQNGANNTIIDCGGSPTSPQRAFEFVSGEDADCIIRGLTIKGGYGPEASGTSSGGAVYLEGVSPTFADCIFEENAATLGGAVFCRNADPTFIGCSFLANSATIGSAILALDNSQITLERCLISLNEDSQPVGCANGGTISAARCNIFGNEAGDWDGCLADLYPGYGNLCYDPLFCPESADPLTVDALSPCLPEQNSLQQCIGANEEGCRHWQMVGEVHVSDKLHAGIRPLLGKKNTGVPETVPGPSLYRYLTATFLSSVSIQSGDQATVYLAQNSEGIFETGVLREAVVISASGEPTRQAVVEVKLEEGDAEYYPHLGLEAIGEWNLLDESRQVIDYLTLDPGTTGASERQPLAAGTEIPEKFALFANYPNPFNASTVIQFALPHEQQVEIAIYDILGRKVKALTNETFPAGIHTITWHGTGDRNTPAPSGLYFCKLISRDYQATMKMVLLK